jgi:hypothetical protein
MVNTLYTAPVWLFNRLIIPVFACLICPVFQRSENKMFILTTLNSVPSNSADNQTYKPANVMEATHLKQRQRQQQRRPVGLYYTYMSGLWPADG